ncbi:MAG: DUF5060 domain-containing protein [Verrucomicrobiae bacterium]|nr:DUF5060 domain-containing protein [Verrucomicrobiae bacterium]
MKRSLTILVGWCLGASPWYLPAADSAPPGRRLSVEVSQPVVGRFEKIEFTFPFQAVADNPHDPVEVDVRLEMVTPSGDRLTLPGFIYQPFERLTRAGRQGEGEAWYPAGKPVWKVRFAPAEVGRYRAWALVTDRAGSVASEEFTFESRPSNRPGFLRVSAHDYRYLEYTDGRPFFAVGQNIAFIKDVGLQGEMLRRFGAAGGNFARVWACAEDWGLGIEARKSAWGRSWSWNPPLVISPDAAGYHANRLCVKLSGEAGATLTMNPSQPVVLRAQTAYTLRLAYRAEGQSEVSFELAGSQTLPPRRQWTPWSMTFTNLNWAALPPVVFRLPRGGTVWMRDFSLQEAGGGPELLEEADPNRPVMGVYNERDCFYLDRVLETAEQSGVHLQIVLFTRDHYMHLLRQAGGRGYRTATDYARRLLRYAVARWGYSTHVAAWEYFNEMDPGLPTEAFYTELGRYLDTVDVYRHLRVNSTWHSPSKDYAHPDLDAANQHHYLRPPSGEIWKDEVASILAQYEINRARLKERPLFFAEYGITDANWQRAPELEQDKEWVHLHNGLWLTLALGYGSTVCHWYWDDVHRRNAYAVYEPVARFVRDIPFTQAQLKPVQVSITPPLKAFGQKGEGMAYFWIWHPQATWWRLAMEKQEAPVVRDAVLEVPDMAAGACQVQWFNTREGQPLQESTVASQGGRLQLRVPEFRRDVAVKIRWQAKGN